MEETPETKLGLRSGDNKLSALEGDRRRRVTLAPVSFLGR